MVVCNKLINFAAWKEKLIRHIIFSNGFEE